MASINVSIDHIIWQAQEDLFAQLIATIYNFHTQHLKDFENLTTDEIENLFGDFREHDLWGVIAAGYREESRTQWDQYWDTLSGPIQHDNGQFNPSRLHHKLLGELMEVCVDFKQRWRAKYQELSLKDIVNLCNQTNSSYGSADDYDIAIWIEALISNSYVVFENVIMYPLMQAVQKK